MANNSAVRKNHLKQSLQTSRAEVLRLNEAAADDIDALNTLFLSLGLRVDTNGNIYQTAPE